MCIPCAAAAAAVEVEPQHANCGSNPRTAAMGVIGRGARIGGRRLLRREVGREGLKERRGGPGCGRARRREPRTQSAPAVVLVRSWRTENAYDGELTGGTGGNGGWRWPRPRPTLAGPQWPRGALVVLSRPRPAQASISIASPPSRVVPRSMFESPPRARALRSSSPRAAAASTLILQGSFFSYV